MIGKSSLLSDRVLLITGAAKGLGRALTLRCAEAGASLILCDKEVRALELLQEEIELFSRNRTFLIPINFEGATLKDYETLVNAITSKFDRINGLIFNAATLGELAPLEHYDPIVWAKVFQVNLHSTFLMLKYCSPIIENSKNSNVIFTLAPEICLIKPFWGAYAVSKKALLGLMELTCSEMASYDRVKVNGVVPSPMRTDLHRQAYPAGDFSLLDTPEQNAETYIKILTEHSCYKNGEVIELGKKNL